MSFRHTSVKSPKRRYVVKKASSCQIVSPRHLTSVSLRQKRRNFAKKASFREKSLTSKCHFANKSLHQKSINSSKRRYVVKKLHFVKKASPCKKSRHFTSTIRHFGKKSVTSTCHFANTSQRQKTSFRQNKKDFAEAFWRRDAFLAKWGFLAK